MPYLAFELDALDAAPHVARAAGIQEDAVIAGLLRMWAWCWRRKTDRVEPMTLRGFFGADATAALGAFGFLEVQGEAIRVKGSDRYLRIAEARSENGKAAAARGNLKRGSRRQATPETPSQQPQQVPSTLPTAAGELLENSPNSAPALSASSEQRALEASTPTAREETKPPDPVTTNLVVTHDAALRYMKSSDSEINPPPPEPLPDRLEAAVEVWDALETVRCEAFNGIPKRDPPHAAQADLVKFAAAHNGNVRWALDTQQRWFDRDSKYVATLNPPGKTEVLLKPSQWPDFQRPASEVDPPPAPSVGPCRDCGEPAETSFNAVPICFVCFARSSGPTPWQSPNPDAAPAAGENT